MKEINFNQLTKDKWISSYKDYKFEVELDLKLIKYKYWLKIYKSNELIYVVRLSSLDKIKNYINSYII